MFESPTPPTVSTPPAEFKVAPAGFTMDQWETFQRDGILFIEDAIAPEDVKRYREALYRVAGEHEGFRESGSFGREHIVDKDPVLTELIDHPRHIGFAYDVYGELTKLHLTQMFLRGPMKEGEERSMGNGTWHVDGPRALPYTVFAPELPLVIKIGYWLSDMPRENMGNLVVYPGGHRMPFADFYDTNDSPKGELPLCVKAGTMTIMYASIWHRVDANYSSVTRENVFLAYSPSWIIPGDRWHVDEAWLSTLSREQRILMREYPRPYMNAKPPAEDFPLYLDRDSRTDRDPHGTPEHVRLERRKRLTWVEKLKAERV